MKKIKRTIAALIAAAGLIMAVSGCGEVSSVKDAYLTQYSSSVTVGDAVDGFLSNPKWEYFESTEGDDVVQVDGECTYMDEDAKVELQFVISGDTFTVHAMSINGVEQEYSVIEGFLEKIYEDAE